jgi:hypothetical protein
MRGHQAFDVTAAVAARGDRSAAQHGLRDEQQLLGDVEIGQVARLVERDQDLVGQSTAVAG